MDFFIPDGSMYIAFVLLTAFVVCMASHFAASQTVNKQISVRQGNLYVAGHLDVRFSCSIVPSIYSRYKMTCSVRRQESVGEQDEEGPYSRLFFA